MSETENANSHKNGTATGPGASIGERITGVYDSRDPDGLITLNDLPDRNGDASDLSDLVRKASQYGNQQEGTAGTTREN
ncbi:hypothetical protein [Mycetocola zhadangensis]|uniref:Uncharacterized protein n=1 Tax=Mycetocola zhadangensis TaxID=1164595 RepID=A0A3L7J6J5_9MICO|nr:hypothetical protein [Mycetocola zhadangensis]RLQ86328.1 hypothetical protein D9V28_05770 [Mycetocola zhadangensis]GGE90215.1 hypothetical protein GCM10011313_11390 [Mycetocola zhadangensis]